MNHKRLSYDDRPDAPASRAEELVLSRSSTVGGPKVKRSERTLIQHKTAGLFAGIGGLERGLERAGHQATLLCENDPAAVEVLRTRFSDVRRHGDIRTLRALPRGTTLVAAGFPCQDLSQAGKTRGIA